MVVFTRVRGVRRSSSSGRSRPAKHPAHRSGSRQAKNRELEAEAMEIRRRAERRLGELLADTPMRTGGEGSVGPVKGGSKKEPPLGAPPPTLDEVLELLPTPLTPELVEDF